LPVTDFHPYRCDTPQHRSRAFTLLELLVVLTLISIMMALSLPRLRTSIINDPLKQSARQVIAAVKEARQRAAASEEGCLLSISIDTGTISLSCEKSPRPQLEDPAASDEVFDEEKERENVTALISLTDPVRFRSVWNSSGTRFSIGEVELWLNRAGLIEPCIINLSDGSREIGLDISPFMPDIRIGDQALVPEDSTYSEALL
jgi:general secretion pathway protein H